MTREKFPEKVPFRLTRMMIKAMEVSGIEGNFRSALCSCPAKDYNEYRQSAGFICLVICLLLGRLANVMMRVCIYHIPMVFGCVLGTTSSRT